MSKWIKNTKDDLVFLESMAEKVREFNLIAKGFHDISRLGVSNQALLVREEAEECVEAFKGDLKGAFLKELCDVFITASYLDFLIARNPELIVDNNRVYDKQTSDSYAYWYRENLISFDGHWREALRNVIQSNESKMWPLVGEDIRDKHCEVLMADGRYKGVTWKQLGNNYIVYQDDKGKVLKGPRYFDPMETGHFEK